MNKYKYVVVGNSAAAVGGIEGIRRYDPDGEILLFTDEVYHTYSRPLISYWLEGRVSDNKIYYRKENFYEKNKVTVKYATSVTSVNAEEHVVEAAGGKRYGYEKLLIATGSRPFIPPITGLNKVEERYTFMDWDNTRSIKSKCGVRVLIMGAGLIGLKAAEALSAQMKDVTVIDLADMVMPSVLNNDASGIIKARLESNYVKFVLGSGAESFINANTVKLSDGTKIDFDTLIIAVGVRPNTELVKEAGGDVNRGIVCGGTQKTSLDDVYAAGDCTESIDITDGTAKIMALLPNAYRQGEIAGANMAGHTAVYDDAIPMNAIGFYGLHVITAGAGNIPLADGITEYVRHNGDDYKRLVFSGNKLIGYILTGKEVERAGIYTSIIRQRIDLADIEGGIEALSDKPQMLLFNKERRKEKLARAV